MYLCWFFDFNIKTIRSLKTEKNTDLRILVKRIKIFKHLTVLFAILTPLPLLGIGLRFPYSYIFVALCILLFIAAFVFAFLCRYYTKRSENNVSYLKDLRDKVVAANNSYNKYLADIYANIDIEDCKSNEENKNFNQVAFMNEGIVFSAQGTFTVKKDFNGVKGNHLALQICGTKLLSAPKDYADVLDYENNLFKLNIGYFEDCPLTEENDNGLILPEVDYINKTISFSSGRGYVCDLDTAESDEIDCGELVISEFTENSLNIIFKCIVKYGAADVVFGAVNLTRETRVSD